MGGIAAIFLTDKRPLEASLIEDMLERIAHRGPSNCLYETFSSVALGRRNLFADPTSGNTLAFQHIAVALDGRIDNREELLLSLSLSNSSSNEELIATAYLEWGETFADKLHGDFAIVLWDQKKERFVCARDIVGIRPLYYYWDGKTFLAGSELQELTIQSLVSQKPNFGFFAEYLANRLVSNTDTLFENFFRLPGGHYLVIDNIGLKTHKYWQANLKTANKTTEDFKEELHSILSEAILSRIKNQNHVGIQLSGGIDSSTIALLTETLMSGTKIKCETFSMVFPGERCDESDYIDSVTSNSRLTNHKITPQLLNANWVKEQVCRFSDLPDYPNGIILHELRKEVSKRQTEIFLTGLGGDHLFTGGYFSYLTLIKKLDAGRLLEQLKSDPHLYNFLSACTPNNVKNVLRRFGLAKEWIPPELNSSFVKKVALHERLNDESACWSKKGLSLQHWHTICDLSSGSSQHFTELWERDSSSLGLIDSHPFLDRKLIEFSLTIPETLLNNEGKTKYILRESVKDILPEKVYRREDKADFGYPFIRLLKELGGRDFFKNLTLSKEGFLNEAEVLKLYDRTITFNDNPEDSDLTWNLWCIVGGEQILSNLF